MTDVRENEQGVPVGSRTGTPWSPILSGDARERALFAVDALVSEIESRAPDRASDASLSSGAAGLAVLYAELARVDDSTTAGERAEAHLERATAILASAPLGASLFAGFTGIAWAAELLWPNGADDVNEEIDVAVQHALDRVDWAHAPYDLIYGLTGLGVYAVERWPRPAAQAALERIVEELARLAHEDEHGAYWWTSPPLLLGPHRDEYPDGYVNLGVAHGMPAVIPLLAHARALGAARDEAAALSERAVRWLLAHLVDGATGPTVPYLIAPGRDPQPARLAWCYGDAGVAAALLAAAHAAGEPDWNAAARELAAGAARRDPTTTAVGDVGFCHGSAGLAHLFNRMYQATGDAELRAAAQFWVEQTLDGLEGATAYNGPGLLEGAAGVALSLLAASTDAEPRWDRMYLVAPLTQRAAPSWPETETAAPV